MVQVKTALLAAMTGTVIILINWVIDFHFITGLVSGWHLSNWLN